MLLSQHCIFLLNVHNFTYLQRLLGEIIGTISLTQIHTYLCYNVLIFGLICGECALYSITLS